MREKITGQTVPPSTIPRTAPALFGPSQGKAEASCTSQIQRRFWTHLWRLSEPARLLRQIRKNLESQRQTLPSPQAEGWL